MGFDGNNYLSGKLDDVSAIPVTEKTERTNNYSRTRLYMLLSAGYQQLQ